VEYADLEGVVASELVRIARDLVAGPKAPKLDSRMKSVLDDLGLEYMEAKYGSYSSMSASSIDYFFEGEISKAGMDHLEKEWARWEKKQLSGSHMHLDRVYVFRGRRPGTVRVNVVHAWYIRFG
jgi:sulfite reductase beta subunit-like hemoprotein